ncbi:MAG: BMP family protein [Ignisphaera sp.]
MYKKSISITAKILIIVLIIIIAVASGAYFLMLQQTGKTPTTTIKPAIKMAAILPGSIHDADYNTLGYLAVLKVHDELGIETAYSEKVAVPDAERVMREYISLGYNVIWAHGAQFNTALLKIAEEYPNVVFIMETDAPLTQQPKNVWVMDRNFPIGFYELGAIAALTTKTGKIGYIGGIDLPFSKAEVNAVLQAIRDVNPSVKLRYAWTGDFNDPVKARSLAESMIAEGIDFILSSVNLGNYGIIEAVRSSGKTIYMTVKYTDKSSFAPENIVTSYIYDFSVGLIHVLKEIEKGNTSGYYKLEFGSACYILYPLKNVSKEIEDKAVQIDKALREGRIVVPFNTTLPVS